MEEEENVVDDPFPGITDIALIVEDREIHTVKAFLMSASPVFNAMFTSDFKEKSEQRIHSPEKTYDDFVLFLKMLHRKEYLELNDDYHLNNLHSNLFDIITKYDFLMSLDNCGAYKRLSPETKTEILEKRLSNVEKSIRDAYHCACQREYALNCPIAKIREDMWIYK
ncbi:uncharacterized protein LOC134281743 [Saccostrea cucullata]|uniref:uncharacterized protein LOC134281743 n=1 Tax=Saccostrea cuccullata TaxID=36930 RepID=UPI002ED62A83